MTWSPYASRSFLRSVVIGSTFWGTLVLGPRQELTKLTAQLESTWKRALFARQLVEGDIQLAAEVSFWYLSFSP